jgi:type II secretory pathway pseudopilin PulG
MKNNKGFTLIELMVSLTIAMITCMAIITIVGGGSLVNKRMMFEAKAYKLAQSILEQPKYAPGPAYLNLNVGVVIIPNKQIWRNLKSSSIRVEVTSIDYVEGSIIVPSKKIKVTIDYNQPQLTSIDLTTVITYKI